MTAPSTLIPTQKLIDAAKNLQLAYNDKKWDAIKAALTSDFSYDEVGTQRKTQGADAAITLWKGWAAALPDSKATIHSAVASGSTVVLEVTWKGTHNGPLQMPAGPVAPTGKAITLRACIVVEFTGEKIKGERHYFDMATMLQQLGVTA